MRATMTGHTLFARCLDGSILEIGQVGAAETAARLQHALERELGEEYRAFWIVEDEPVMTCRGLRYDELRPAPPQDRRAAVRH